MQPNIPSNLQLTLNKSDPGAQPRFKSTSSRYCAKLGQWRHHYDAEVIIVTSGKTWKILSIGPSR